MLSQIAALLVSLHVIGAALGAGGVTFAEIAYARALADNRIEAKERAYFAKSYWALRWGLLTVLLSGLALIIVQYFLPDSPAVSLYAPLWIQNTLALAITISASYMGRGTIPWWLGSSIAFAGLWMIFILDLGVLFSFPYLVLLFTYIIAVFASAGFWGYVRSYFHDRAKTRHTHRRHT